MRCPYCDHNDSKVTDSRSVEHGIRRRRECLKCGARFTTYERVDNSSMTIVKKDKRRESYSREKLMSGIRKACQKRPLPTGTIDKLVDEIEAEMHSMGKSEIPSSVLGELVMEKLLALDHIAYIRYASVYRSFTDIGSLKKEVDSLAARHEIASQLPLIPREDLSRTNRN
ncbi:MAG: transcriptional regulator NrdR [Dehalococcoidia bacterium]|nr:transcriptional regulator NrdR [Dehalococcoidia bacterium]